MTKVSLGLSYWLPRTEIGIALTKRTTVHIKDDGTSWPKVVVDAVVTPKAVEDPAAQQTLTLEERALANLDLTVELDDRGFISSINSESSRDITPILNLVGKAVGLAATVLKGVVKIEPTSLDEQWATRNKNLAGLINSLSARVKFFLDEIAAATDPAKVKALGDAVAIVQSQLGSISEARRAWIAAQAVSQATKTFALRPADLFAVGGTTLPAHLPDDRTWSVGDDNIATDFGVIIAIAEQPVEQAPGAAGTGPGAGTEQPAPVQTNSITIRRPRKATLGVYLLSDDKKWNLDPTSVSQVDIVDETCATDYLTLDGKWLHGEKFQLAYHPDMSLKTFGFSAMTTAAGPSTAAGGVLDSIGTVATSLATRPTADQQQLAAATTQLDLLNTRNEFEVLSATRARAAELAVLQQNAAIAQAST